MGNLKRTAQAEVERTIKLHPQTNNKKNTFIFIISVRLYSLLAVPNECVESILAQKYITPTSLPFSEYPYQINYALLRNSVPKVRIHTNIINLFLAQVNIKY